VSSDNGAVVLYWDISAKGRFVDENTANGRVKFEMKIGSGGQIQSCGKRSLAFTAKRVRRG